MKRLPNGLVVFNASPHPLKFWKDGWDAPVVVQPDGTINATPTERTVSFYCPTCQQYDRHEDGCPDEYTDANIVKFVRTEYAPNTSGHAIIAEARKKGADVIVGSIISAQAYPGDVVAVVPSPGFGRVPADKKRALPDKFIIF